MFQHTINSFVNVEATSSRHTSRNTQCDPDLMNKLILLPFQWCSIVLYISFRKLKSRFNFRFGREGNNELFRITVCWPVDLRVLWDHSWHSFLVRYIMQSGGNCLYDDPTASIDHILETLQGLTSETAKSIRGSVKLFSSSTELISVPLWQLTLILHFMSQLHMYPSVPRNRK